MNLENVKKPTHPFVSSLAARPGETRQFLATAIVWPLPGRGRGVRGVVAAVLRSWSWS